MTRLGAMVLAAALVVLAGCPEADCSGGAACRGDNGNCMKCETGTCNGGGTCSASVNGVACCVGGGGGGGATCGCGTQCNSNGICCPRLRQHLLLHTRRRALGGVHELPHLLSMRRRDPDPDPDRDPS